MKSLAPFAFALFASCAVNDAPATSSASSAVSVLGTDVLTSENWFARDTHTIDDVWPAGQGITSTQILVRKGPCRNDPNNDCTSPNAVQTFMAVVVWNHSTVGHIYWVTKGTDGSDFHNLVDNALGTRCNTNPDHGGGWDGSPYVGTPPAPHPNVNGWAFDVDTTFNQNAKDAAAQLDAWTGPQSVFANYVVPPPKQ